MSIYFFNIFCLIKIMLSDWEKLKQEGLDGANRSLEFKHGIIQIVCAVENLSLHGL